MAITKDEAEMFGKIVAARLRLKEMKIAHITGCATEDLTGTAPCNCGVTGHNQKIDSLLDELKLSFE